jgi:hypothetical protein
LIKAILCLAAKDRAHAIAKHIDLSVTRRETLPWLTLLIMQHGTICLNGPLKATLTAKIK